MRLMINVIFWTMALVPWPMVISEFLEHRDVLDWPYGLSPYTGMYWIDCIEMYWIETLYCAYCIGLSPYTVWIETLYWDVLDWLYRDVLDWVLILRCTGLCRYTVYTDWVFILYGSRHYNVLTVLDWLYRDVLDWDIIMCLLYWIDYIEMYWIETL